MGSSILSRRPTSAAQGPAALTTASAASLPRVVSTATTAPCASRSMAVTVVSSINLAPWMRAPRAKTLTTSSGDAEPSVRQDDVHPRRELLADAAGALG